MGKVKGREKTGGERKKGEGEKSERGGEEGRGGRAGRECSPPIFTGAPPHFLIPSVAPGLVWVLTKKASDREGSFDWRQVTGHLTGNK